MGEEVKKFLEEYEKLCQKYEMGIVGCGCCGSGTTCVACKNTNRRYIGIELNPKWHKIAVDRLNNIQANGQQTLFTM